ncbi:MAG: M28 family peptidase [Oligoflexia bacterium]|nr:M28 family peptidase [Oligoflexia bacterium]
MFKVILVFTVFFLSFTLANANANNWLIINQDPQIMSKINEISTTVLNKGRIHVVTLNVPYAKLTEKIKKSLRVIKLEEINQYQLQLSQSGTQVETPIPWIKELTKKITADSIKNFVLKIVDQGNRSTGSLDSARAAGNELTQKMIKSYFESWGYSSNLHCYKNRKYAKECNVYAIKKAANNSKQTIIVQGHLDSVNFSKAGADDNASGTAGVLELAKQLKDIKTNINILFVANNGEEDGLVGSEAYVELLTQNGEIGNIILTINMDMIAYNSNNNFEIETNKEYEELANWIGKQAILYGELNPIITMPAWGSDHVPYLDAKVPSYLSIEEWDTHTPCYHRSCDKPDGLNYEYAAKIVRTNFSVIIQKADLEIENR